VKLYEPLAGDFPSVPAYRRELAASHNNLGFLLAGLRKHGEAEAAYRAALTLYDRLAADFPSVPMYRQELAASHHNLGIVLYEMGEHGKAETAFRAALRIKVQLVDDFRSVPAYRRDLAISHNCLAVVLQPDPGRREEAEVAYRASLRIQEQLAEDFPSVPDYAVELGNSYSNFGIMVSLGGEPQLGLDWFAKAIGALEPVLQKEPRLVAARRFLGTAHRNRALALEMLNRHAEAVQDWDRAIEVDDGRDKTKLRQLRARSQLLSGLNQHPAWPLLWGWPQW
jgi:tetratricopeptide (TPR) repeat protein